MSLVTTNLRALPFLIDCTSCVVQYCFFFTSTQVALPDVEPLIHFALNCGTKGCPPIKSYTPQVNSILTFRLKIA